MTSVNVDPFLFRFAEAVRDGSCYFVLLIITDGVITDLPQTKQAIVHVSECVYLTPNKQ